MKNRNTTSQNINQAIEIGLKVGTFEEYGETLSVDTSEDYERVQRLMCKDELYLESNGYD